jgi:acetylornithine deacetylase/succinyl-diaminopimelate desuccinylase-like protein
VLLEAARALASGDRPRNDVIVLFDDGEELGDYRGGELFAAHHPWRHLVRHSHRVGHRRVGSAVPYAGLP